MADWKVIERYRLLEMNSRETPQEAAGHYHQKLKDNGSYFQA